MEINTWGWYNSLLKSICNQTREMILCYNSLLKPLCYQTEESNPILQTILFLCNSILCNHFSAIPFSVPNAPLIHFPNIKSINQIDNKIFYIFRNLSQLIFILKKKKHTKNVIQNNPFFDVQLNFACCRIVQIHFYCCIMHVF